MKTLRLLALVLCLYNVPLLAQNNKGEETKPVSKSSISLENLVKQKSPNYVITKDHTSKLSGVHHVYLRQAIGGLEIYGTESSVHFDRNGKVLISHNKFLDNIESTVKSSMPSLSASQAIASVASQMNYKLSGLQQLKNIGGAGKQAIYNKAGISSVDIPVKLMYYYREGLGTDLAWELSIAETSSTDWWNFRVDATTGTIIDKDNWTVSCNILGDHENHIQNNAAEETAFVGPINKIDLPAATSSALVGSYNVYPMPIENPNYGVRSLVANPENLTASPFGWHDTNGVAGSEFTDTRGNNTDTYDDDNANNLPDGKYADGGAGLVFDFPLNTTYSGGDQSENAAITNLFYWTNIIHDVTYMYGFDEASGNFQHNNYGNGGLGNDPVNAEAQDGSGTCNANFGTPPDGSRPRMQMYVCGSRDGDLDNMVIIHEYAHGISNRLSSLGGQEQMGEGWSDYYGLMLTMGPGDAGPDSRGVGTWLIGQGPGGAGIRAFPYSTNFGVNPHTYDDIITAVAPHGVGSVWAMMLWEMTWEIMGIVPYDPDIYTGTGGNNIALALVTEGLKLQANLPGFVDGRDAILAADQALYGGAYQCAIWDAFARRGLGYSAVQGTSASQTDNSEAFDLPPSFSSLDVISEVCLADGIQNGLSGGNPTGGVYSGLGVTDDGNGTSFTFDPSIGGPGLVTISYTVNDFCTGLPTAIMDDIDVTDEPPVIICRGSGTIPMTGSVSSSPGVAIPDNNPTGVTTTMNVLENVVITDLDVNLDIPHTWVGDLTVTLRSPLGTTAVIVDRPGVPASTFGCPENNIDATLDDEAGTPVELECAASPPAIFGTFIPNNPLSVFDGENTVGLWELTVVDAAGGDLGTIGSWGINYAYEVVSTPLDVYLDAGGNATINASDLLFSASIACGGMLVEGGTPFDTTVSFTLADVGLTNVDMQVTSDTGQITTCTAIANVIASAVSNDLCADAVSINCGDVVIGSTIGMTPDGTPFCGTSNTAPGVWYTWTGTGDCVSLTTCGIGTNFDTKLTVYEGTCSGLVCVGGDDDSPCAVNNLFSTVDFVSTAGTQYLILVHGFGAAEGDFELSITCPTVANDEVCSAISIPVGGSVHANGKCATAEAGEPNPGAGTGASSCDSQDGWCAFETDIQNSLWYQFIAPTTGNVSIETIGTGDPQLALWEVGDCNDFGTFVEIAANDDGGAIFNSLISNVCVTPGQTYWIQIDGFNGSIYDVDIVITENNADPIAICQDITVQLDPSGTVTITAGQIDNGSTAICGIDTIEVFPDTFTCADIGPNNVILTVTDVNGNIGTCTAVVTVEDDQDPVLTCPGDILVSNDPGLCGAVVTFTPTATDNCAVTITSVPASGSVFPVGTALVTVTATDEGGNTDQCTFNVTVEDNEDPVITCASDDTRDTDPAVCTYTIVGTEFDATFTDNCANGSITNDMNGTDTIDGEILAPGVYTVVWTVDDGNGQTATCTTVITVEDNENPVPICPADIVVSNEPGLCEAAVFYNPTATDNCGIATVVSNPPSGTIFPVGTTTVTVTATDIHGNTDICTFDVTVEDDEDPIIACPSDISANTDPGDCFATVFFADAIALDNCGVASVVQTDGDPSGSQFPVGVSTIEFTATDIHGNTAVCTFTITVTDNEPAMAVCQDITIELDEFGNASIVAADVDGGSTDNCGVDFISIDIDTFDCSDVGDNPVVLTVTDVNGNVSSCTAIVTVVDVTDPVAVCMDITVQLDASGSVTILGSDVDGGSTDACGIASYDLDIDTFDCSNVGDNTVVLTVTDVNGNTSTCTAIVTVEDVTAPDLVCMDITLELGPDGTATIVPEDVIASNDDACGILTTAVDIFEFDCSDIGTPVVVQVFAMDVNGNLSTCFATVTVVDLLEPVLTCPADQTVDPGPGNLFYEVPDYFAIGEATAIDNCTDPVVITTQDPAPGTLLPDGVYTITLTAEDEYGNIATCEFELTIESILGIGDNSFDISSIVMYPNPANAYLMLGNPNQIDLQHLSIYDLTGRLIKTINLTNMGTEKAIDISQLASAPYMFVVEAAQGRIVKTIIKE